jgi:hypothetical protein
MNFSYGSYVHPNGEVNFAGIQRTIQYSPTQRANIFREAWSMKGKIVQQGPNSQSLVFASLAAIRNAYSVNGYSAGFLDNDGSQTPFWLNNANSIGGVTVTNPVSHGEMGGAETVTYLHYTFGLQMDSFISAPDTILDYSEQLSFSDNFGGPILIERLPLNGIPIQQAVSSNSFFYATQSGSLTMRTPNPAPESPIFPNAFSGSADCHQVTYSSPKMERGVPLEYTVNWSYKFRSIYPLTGSVHARG